jgi:deoxyribodipyrimidine photo-lyase
MPDTFTPFRNKVEKKCSIHSPLQIPRQLDKFSITETNNQEDLSSRWEHEMTWMPTLEDLGYTQEQVDEAQTLDPRGVMQFVGGETAALARVKDYIWEKDLLRNYFDTRNGMIGADYSSKFSPWLAHGNVSPRYIAQQCKQYEEERVANKSTYWLVFELLWRDFFKFFALKHGSAIFFPGGTIGSDKAWKHFDKNVQAWIEGKTGFPLVDANMRELAATGFMSNRGRQNVCSFLALELNEDWRYGADYFESTLLDYDPYSNWGNWCAGAGMTGGRLNRFNIVKQSKDYDQHGDYVRHWIPELKDVPTQFVHEPWKMSQFQQTESNCRIGVDYPNPVTKPFYPNYKDGSRSKGDDNNNSNNKSRKNNSNNNNSRGRGQRRDMKSLKQGRYEIVGEIVG